MIAKLEAPRERASEGDDRMINENDTLCTRTGVVKKPSRYDNGKLKRKMLGIAQTPKYLRYLIVS